MLSFLCSVDESGPLVVDHLFCLTQGDSLMRSVRVSHSDGSLIDRFRKPTERKLNHLVLIRDGENVSRVVHDVVDSRVVANIDRCTWSDSVPGHRAVVSKDVTLRNDNRL